jgi:hypothetical protein
MGLTSLLASVARAVGYWSKTNRNDGCALCKTNLMEMHRWEDELDGAMIVTTLKVGGHASASLQRR